MMKLKNSPMSKQFIACISNIIGKSENGLFSFASVYTVLNTRGYVHGRQRLVCILPPNVFSCDLFVCDTLLMYSTVFVIKCFLSYRSPSIFATPGNDAFFPFRAQLQSLRRSSFTARFANKLSVLYH
jgi:hypothetical protein